MEMDFLTSPHPLFVFHIYTLWCSFGSVAVLNLYSYPHAQYYGTIAFKIKTGRVHVEKNSLMGLDVLQLKV